MLDSRLQSLHELVFFGTIAIKVRMSKTKYKISEQQPSWKKNETSNQNNLTGKQSLMPKSEPYTILIPNGNVCFVAKFTES